MSLARACAKCARLLTASLDLPPGPAPGMPAKTYVGRIGHVRWEVSSRSLRLSGESSNTKVLGPDETCRVPSPESRRASSPPAVAGAAQHPCRKESTRSPSHETMPQAAHRRSSSCNAQRIACSSALKENTNHNKCNGSQRLATARLRGNTPGRTVPNATLSLPAALQSVSPKICSARTCQGPVQSAWLKTVHYFCLVFMNSFSCPCSRRR